MAFPRVIWITGLSGAGKSTLANELAARLRARGRPVILLDGDELREVFGPATEADPHSREGRLALARQYAKLCRLLAGQGFTVIVATISLFREIHHWNRDNIKDYMQVYLRVPVDELLRRDPKGIYRSFFEGTLKNVAGLDMPVDEPEHAEFVFNHHPEVSAAAMADRIVQYCHRG